MTEIADAIVAALNGPRGPEIASLVFERIKDSKHAVSMTMIQGAVAAHYGVTVGCLKSRVRIRAVTERRQVAMYLARELTGASYPTIGRAFDRDHTTVMSACKAIRRRMLRADDDIADTLDHLRRVLRGNTGQPDGLEAT